MLSKTQALTESPGERRPGDLLDLARAADDGDKLDDRRVERRAELRAQRDAHLGAVRGRDRGDVPEDLLDLGGIGRGVEREGKRE